MFFVAAAGHIRAVMSELQRLESPYRRIAIVGGGNIGAGLARQLEKRYSVKLIERNQKRAEQLSEHLEHTIVFCGDAADQELLAEEHIDQIDVFIAVTNEDEANIMSALLAKKMGPKKTMVLIQRGAYVDLVQGGSIDIAISPAGHHLCPADPCAPCRHRQRLACAAGGRSHRGDRPRGREHLQGGGQDGGRAETAPGTTIGAVVRGDEVLIAHDRTQIQQDDHVVMFLVDKVHPGSGASVPAQSLLPVSRPCLWQRYPDPAPFSGKVRVFFNQRPGYLA